jgi:uncharacterized protein (TIGR02271 family)
MRTFTALYDSRADAEAAQNQLKELGIIPSDGVNLADQNTAGFSPDRSADNRGFWGSLKAAFLPHEDRQVYEAGIREGGYLLTVSVNDESADQVETLLEQSNAVDVDEREQRYREAGLLEAQRASEPARADAEAAIPLVEEQLRVGKREVSRGGVRIRSHVVETPVREQVSLREEHVEVERRPMNQPIENADELLQERTLEATEMAEEAVVSKEAVVREEVSLKKDVTERTEEISDTVRRTEVDLEDARKAPRT